MPFKINTFINNSLIHGAGNGRFFGQNCKKGTLVREQDYNSDELVLLSSQEDIKKYNVTTNELVHFCHSIPKDHKKNNIIYINRPPMVTNHSDDPNIYYIYSDKKRTYTLKDVKKGEEMYQDYNQFTEVEWFTNYLKDVHNEKWAKHLFD